MSFKNEVQKLVKAELKKLEDSSRIRSHGIKAFKEHQLIRFKPLRALLDELVTAFGRNYIGGKVWDGDWVDDYDVEVIFTTPEQGSVVDWCKKHEWDYDRIVKSLVEECSGSKQSSKKKPAKKRSAPKSKKPPKKVRSLSPEQAKMLKELYKLKVSTYKKSSEDGEK